MTPIRKFFYYFAVFLAFITLMQLPHAFALSSVFGDPNNIDTALKEGGAYENFVPLALEEATKKTTEDNAKELLADEEIRNVVSSSIQPEDVQSAGKSVITGLYDWLEGKTEQPEFTIDLTAAANRASENLGAYAQKRATSLPPCTVEQMRTINFQEDLLSIPCLPFGVTPAQVGQQFTEQAKQDVELLKNPIISSENLREQGNTTELSNSNLPETYQALHSSKWLVLGLAAILLGLLVFARRDRWAGVRVVGILLLVCAALLVLTLVLFSLGKAQVPAENKIAEVITSTVINVVGQLFDVTRWFAVGYAILGTAALLAVRKFAPKPEATSSPTIPGNPVITS